MPYLKAKEEGGSNLEALSLHPRAGVKVLGPMKKGLAERTPEPQEVTSPESGVREEFPVFKLSQSPQLQVLTASSCFLQNRADFFFFLIPK